MSVRIDQPRKVRTRSNQEVRRRSTRKTGRTGQGQLRSGAGGLGGGHAGQAEQSENDQTVHLGEVERVGWVAGRVVSRVGLRSRRFDEICSGGLAALDW